jgi:peptidoglycan hydrolase-like protein with peptidoglycan-binding domain
MKFTHLLIAGAAFVSLGAHAAGDTQRERGTHAAQTQYQAEQGPGQNVVRQAQERLNRAGFDVGPVDGVKGPQTRQGLERFQQANGLAVTGELDQQTLAALGLDWAAGTGAIGATRAGGGGGTVQPSAQPERGPAGGPTTVPDTGEASPTPAPRHDGVSFAPAAGGVTLVRASFDSESVPTRAPDVGEARAPGMSSAPSESREATGGTSGQAATGAAQPTSPMNVPETGEARAPGMEPAPTERTAATKNRDTIREAQRQLNAEGFKAGPVDGIKGPRTREALKRFQEARGLTASGELDAQTMSALGIDGAVGATPGGAGTGAAGSAGR